MEGVPAPCCHVSFSGWCPRLGRSLKRKSPAIDVAGPSRRESGGLGAWGISRPARQRPRPLLVPFQPGYSKTQPRLIWRLVLEGADAAVQAANDMISAGTAWIAQEHGPDEAHRVLRIVEAAQGQGLP
jgi:hypothetical protein